MASSSLAAENFEIQNFELKNVKNGQNPNKIGKFGLKISKNPEKTKFAMIFGNILK